MKAFLDTTVLTAAFYPDHPHHEQSYALLEKLDKKSGATSAHCLAEVYSNLTGMPGKQRMNPDEALLYLSNIRDQVKIITLTESEVVNALGLAAICHVTGGGIYDALIAQAALKSKARHLYTWNTKHFTRLSDQIAKRVRTP